MHDLPQTTIGGIAVHIGARIASKAAPGEVLVSRTAQDLVSGDWRLHAAVDRR